MFKLAHLFVDIEARDAKFQGQLRGVQGQLGAFGAATAVAIGNVTSVAILAATRAVAGFFTEGVKGAVDLAETTSKVQAIFGDASGTIQGEAEAMAQKFGTVKTEFLNAASSFGAAFKAAGSSQDDAAKLGNQLAKLGMDMASFGNASNQEVFTALQAALRGEFDPLERFNVMLTAARVSEEAMSLGLIKNAKDLDEASKKQATLSLIMKGTIDQQGDLERTATGTANSWRKLTGTFTNLATTIGTTLEPALNAVVTLANDMALGVEAGAARADGAFKAFADGVKSGVEFVGLVWRNFGDIWEMTTIRIGGAMANAWAYVDAFGQNVVQYAQWIGRNWYTLITDALDATAKAWQNWGDNLYALGVAVMDFLANPAGGFNFEWKPLLTGFEAVAEALPEIIKPALVDVQGEIDAVMDRMIDREGTRLDKLKAKVADAFVGPPEAGKGSSVAVDKNKFKSELVNSADFSAKLRASIFGGDDTAKKTLEVAEKQLEAQKELVVEAKKKKVAVFG